MANIAACSLTFTLHNSTSLGTHQSVAVGLTKECRYSVSISLGTAIFAHFSRE